jgi:hypothetical protein
MDPTTRAGPGRTALDETSLQQRPGTPRARSLEAGILLLLVVTQALLRAAASFHREADSDEPQHLHVVWAWTRGFVQYRDVFDNHAPLFHLLMAPAVALIGERADLLIAARLLMLPLVALSLWATYQLGASLWSSSVGRWAAALCGLAPAWLMTSTEFRADDLWMALWLCSLVALLGGRLTRSRGLLGGLLLGATFATSLKTVMLLVALGCAAATAFALELRSTDRSKLARRVRILAWIAAGFLVVPGGLLAVFASRGALPSLYYCTVTHNTLPGLGLWHHASYRWLLIPAALVVMPWVVPPLVGPGPSQTRQARSVLALTTVFFFVLLEGCWPLITGQDFLPWDPLVALLGVASLHQVSVRFSLPRWAPAGRTVFIGVLSVIAALDVTYLMIRTRPWLDHNRDHTRLLHEVLADTRPDDPIMDLKGETVFRRRPFYFVLETVTRARMALGVLPDRIAQAVIRTRTHFASLDSYDFPPVGRRFLEEHFVPVGALRVLGADLPPDSAGHERMFDVSYPERFVLFADGVPARGTLDDRPYTGPRRLDPGPHRYRPALGEAHAVAVWAGVLARAPLLASVEARSR